MTIKRQNGFSLIEICMTLSLLAIIVAIAFPMYSQHVLTTRRLEAATALSQLAVALERYQIEHNSYQGATFTKLNIKQKAAHYLLAIEELHDNYFMLAAKPQGKQAEKDWECGELLLDSNGKKGVGGTAALENCWS